MADTLDTLKLASYLDGLTRVSQRERDVYTQCLRQRSPQSAGQPVGERVDTLSRVLESLLDAIGDLNHISSKRLADLLTSGGDDASTEEAQALEVLRVMDRATTLDTWGKFKILKIIGAGGFSTVYAAWDPDLEQTVALKLYHPGSHGRSRDELLAEARKLVRVRHPNVVIVHGVDEHDGRVGVCMELVHGQTLAEVLTAQGPLSPEEATTIGSTLCQALAAVHRANLTHADIKAENVLLETGGRIVLMDFGSSRFRDPDAVQYNRLAGTPRYMAPELFALTEPTEQSDIYAVAVLLFHLVTRRFPVDGPSFDAIRRAHENQDPMRLLRDERPELPRTFVDSVERALARIPDERYTNAGQMEQALTMPPRSSLTSAPQSSLSLAAVGLGAAAAVLTVWALGFITSRTFHVALRVPDQFASGGLGLQWGIRPLVPVLFHWSYLLVVLATCIGQSMLVSALANRASPAWRRVLAAVGLADRAGRAEVAGFLLGSIAWSVWTFSQSTWAPAVMVFLLSWIGFPVAMAISRNQPIRGSRAFLPATMVFTAAAVAWLAVTWWQMGVFRALVGLTSLPVDGSSALFAPLSATSQQSYVQAYAYLAFGLAFAIRFVKRLESPSLVDPARIVRGALVVLFGVTLAIACLPYRITWVDYERVAYEGRPAFIVGESADQLHLFFPPGTNVSSRSILRNDPLLTRTGTYGKLFAATSDN
jgi:hypothetical protein